MDGDHNKIYRTRPDMAFLVKYFLGSMALIPAILSAKGLFAYPARVVFIVPVALAGIFCLTSAEIWAEQHSLKYRRFTSWKHVHPRNNAM
jgi:hypothetical protein